MPYKYLGEDYTYHNLVPQVDIKLKKDEVYNVQIASDAQTVIINGQPIASEPSQIRVMFDNGAWIPYMPHRFNIMWEHVS